MMPPPKRQESTMTTLFRPPVILSALLVLASSTGSAQRAPQPSAKPAADATANIVSAAQAVVASLDEAGKAKVQFPFEGPQRTRWSNLPTGIFQRQGLRLGDVTAAQKEAVMKLLTTALRANGYRKVTDVIRGDEVQVGR